MIAAVTQSDGSGLIIILCCAGMAAAVVAGLRERLGSRPTPPIFKARK